MEFYGLNKSDIFYDGRKDEMTQYNKDMTKRQTNPWWYFFTDEYIEYILKICGFKILSKDYNFRLKDSGLNVVYVTEKVK